MQGVGATVFWLQLMGNADPEGSIRRYGEEVLPKLRKVGQPSTPG